MYDEFNDFSYFGKFFERELKFWQPGDLFLNFSLWKSIWKVFEKYSPDKKSENSLKQMTF